MEARVLLVCTANICRSPAAERLLAARLSPSVEFFSRGVRSVPGAAMCPVSSAFAVAAGATVEGHRSTQLEVDDVRSATLILTASERHKAGVISLRPSAQIRTYTLRQAARIIRWRAEQGARAPRGTPADRLLWLAEELDANRGTAPRPVPAPTGGRFFGRRSPRPGAAAPTDSLADPHEGADHAEILAGLAEAVDTFASALDP